MRSEMSLTVLAYNIKRVIRILGIQGLMAAGAGYPLLFSCEVHTAYSAHSSNHITLPNAKEHIDVLHFTHSLSLERPRARRERGIA